MEEEQKKKVIEKGEELVDKTLKRSVVEARRVSVLLVGIAHSAVN